MRPRIGWTRGRRWGAGGSGGGGGSGAATFGLFSDLHHNPDKATAINRHYEDAEEKLSEMVAEFNSRSLDFVICNGDYIDNDGETDTAAIADLGTIEDDYSSVNVTRYYAFGNHDLDALSKAQFIANTGMTEAHYSFDVGGIHFVVLDACYRSDDDADPYDAGNFNHDNAYVPPDERTWLTDDLAATSNPTIVFCHQRLDDSGTTSHEVNNQSAVRTILENSGVVTAVIQGHAHENDHRIHNGIHYYTMQAATENAHPDNAYGVVEVDGDGRIEIEAFGGQLPYVDTVFLAEFAGSGGVIADQSAHGHLVQVNGDANISADRLVLDGDGDYLSIDVTVQPLHVIFKLFDDFTIDAFGVQFNSDTGLQVIAGVYEDTSGRAWTCMFRGDKSPKKLQFQGSTDGSNRTDIEFDWAPADFVTEYDFRWERKDSTVRLYVDGVMLGSTTLAGDLFGASEPFRIGARERGVPGINDFLDGSAAAIRVINGRALNGSDDSFTPETLPLAASFERGAHKWWRLRITEWTSGNEPSCGELEFRATSGGADQATGGTAIASSVEGSNVAANAFADDGGTTYWKGENGSGENWVGYEFTSAVEVEEIAYTSRGGPTTATVMVTGHVEWSDDGVNWRTAFTVFGQGGWSLDETRVFTHPNA